MEQEAKKESYPFKDEECKKAAEKAMSLLLHKDRTERELQDRLYRAGFSELAAEEAMQYVKQFGYINDRRYVENFLMFQKDKRSRKEILYKLQEKGIPQELTQEIMEETEYEGEANAIYNLAQKRLKGRKLSELSFEEKQKIMAYLARKGYPLREIQNVFEEMMES